MFTLICIIKSLQNYLANHSVIFLMVDFCNPFKISVVFFSLSLDVSHKQEGVTLETHPLVASPALEEVIETHKSNDSDRTVSASGSGSISTDSEQTPVRVDSQDSQVSDGEAVDRTWPRQNSVSTIFFKIKVI